METPTSYIASKGVKTFDAGNNYLRFSCPQCKRVETFEFNTLTGQWCCSPPGCGSYGSLYKLKVLWGDALPLHSPPKNDSMSWSDYATQRASEWSDALSNSPKAEPARQYLKLRGFNPHNGACELGRLGWMPPLESDTDDTGWLTIPVVQGDRVVSGKIRKLPPNDRVRPYRNLKGASKALYAPLGIGKRKTLVILGSELDVLSMIQAYLKDGYSKEDIPYSFAAAPDYDSLGVITDAIAHCEDIVLLYPDTTQGKAATERAHGTYGRWRCRVGKWEKGSDANEALLLGELDSFAIESMVKVAKAQGFGGVAIASSYTDRVIGWVESTCTVCYPTGYPTLDSYLGGGGYTPSQTTLLVAPTGSGKTAFVTSLINKMIKQGRNVLVSPTEEGVEAQLYYGAWHYHGFDPASKPNRADLIREYLEWAGSRLIPIDKKGVVDIPSYLETLRYAINRYDISLVVIDNRDRMVDRDDQQWNNLVKLGSGVIDVISQTAAHGVLVVQTDKDKSAKKQAPGQDNIKGRSEGIQDAPCILSLFSPVDAHGYFIKGSDGLYQADVYARKVRDRRGRKGKISFRFDPDSQRFLDPYHTQSKDNEENESPF